MLLEADNIDMKLLLDKTRLRQADVSKNEALARLGLEFYPPSDMAAASVSHSSGLAIPQQDPTLLLHPLDPYEYIYAPVRACAWSPRQLRLWGPCSRLPSVAALLHRLFIMPLR